MKKHKKYNKCRKCGSISLQIEDRIVPVEHSCLDSLGRALLFLIPVIGWIIGIAGILNRKNLTQETIAICKECGYRKDITKKSSLVAKLLLFICIMITAIMVTGLIMISID